MVLVSCCSSTLGRSRVFVDLFPRLPHLGLLFCSLTAVDALSFQPLCPEAHVKGVFGVAAHAHRLPYEAAIVAFFEGRHQVFASWGAKSLSVSKAILDELARHTCVVLGMQMWMHFE